MQHSQHVLLEELLCRENFSLKFSLFQAQTTSTKSISRHPPRPQKIRHTMAAANTPGYWVAFLVRYISPKLPNHASTDFHPVPEASTSFQSLPSKPPYHRPSIATKHQTICRDVRCWSYHYSAMNLRPSGVLSKAYR